MSNKVLVIGAQNIDLFTNVEEAYQLHDSNICDVTMAFGGVGRNLCVNLKRLDNDVSFLSVFSEDAFGTMAKQALLDLGISLDHSLTSKGSNSIYLGIMDQDKDLFLGLNDMKIVSNLSAEYCSSVLDYINTFKYLVIDNNLNQEAIGYLLQNAKGMKIMDAVSAHKINKIIPYLDKIDVLKVNHIEYDKLLELCQEGDIEVPSSLELLVSNGEKAIDLYTPNKQSVMPITCDSIINASGAGDGLLSGYIHGLLNNKSKEVCLDYARKVAHITLQCDDATNKDLSKEGIE
jgi:pseudouridine kinase